MTTDIFFYMTGAAVLIAGAATGSIFTYIYLQKKQEKSGDKYRFFPNDQEQTFAPMTPEQIEKMLLDQGISQEIIDYNKLVEIMQMRVQYKADYTEALAFVLKWLDLGLWDEKDTQNPSQK